VTQLVYTEDGCELYCGDAREVLPTLELAPESTVVITDPVWPNASPLFFGVDDPDGLFATVASMLAPLARRIIVQMGIASDPRMLRHVPSSHPFVRICWLRFARPWPMANLLIGGDVAYIFGSKEPPAGLSCMPGETTARGYHPSQKVNHPSPRTLEHIQWLVDKFTRPGDTVLDPFCGSGTTLRAALDCGRRAVGIEINEAFCEVVIERLAQRVLPLLEETREVRDDGAG